jgi:hypothetical protein
LTHASARTYVRAVTAEHWYRTRRLVGDLLQQGRAWWPSADNYQRIALGPVLHRLAEDYDRVNLFFPPGETQSTLAQREAARGALLASATAAAEAVSAVCGGHGATREVWMTAANLAFTLSLVADNSNDGAGTA